jgi:cobalt-zinc-cadmium resistance protein CzcA
MVKRQFKTRIFLLLGLVCIVTISSIGQDKSISLEEALSMAQKNYVGLERDKLIIEQQNKLAATGIPMQPAQIYLSGEEFGVNKQSGIHSLNIQQNFYLPKASRIQQAYYKQGSVVAEKQLKLTEQELKREVQQAYYQLLYAKEEQVLLEENILLYENFLSTTTSQLKAGETGRVPQMAAKSRLGQTRLEQEYLIEKHQVALVLFNNWLRADTLYDIERKLPLVPYSSLDSVSQSNPHLQIIQAQQELASAKVETTKAQLLPQISSGFKLQAASNSFPLFGYQIGVNIPLSKKAYRGRIEAAEIGVMVQEASLKVKEQELEKTIDELLYRSKHQQKILKYLEQDLAPLVEEQSRINLKAYQEGEVSYLEYLDSLEQVVKVKQQYLTALYKFNVLRIELDYWLGK